MLLIFSFCHLLLEDAHRGREKGEGVCVCASGFRARRLMHLYIGSVGCFGILLSLNGGGGVVFMVYSPFPLFLYFPSLRGRDLETFRRFFLPAAMSFFAEGDKCAGRPAAHSSAGIPTMPYYRINISDLMFS